ncbi:hypothetical protein EST38_g8580 [Candolleomyces aberdarensis]|uniref:Uncharacterized protein n=1 Tax=Candolleomyces aberdarensis TaxID=2316362 RepID=A0A4Q2DEF8_9AGAR|nr:hypothetical protein EST38_g8580 [Candolleomyces aberdarensis]
MDFSKSNWGNNQQTYKGKVVPVQPTTKVAKVVKAIYHFLPVLEYHLVQWHTASQPPKFLLHIEYQPLPSPQSLALGKKIITNVKHFNRVADLEGTAVNTLIIGFTRHGQFNQIFNFEPVGDMQVKITIELLTQGVCAASVNPSPMSVYEFCQAFHRA